MTINNNIRALFQLSLVILLISSINSTLPIAMFHGITSNCQSAREAMFPVRLAEDLHVYSKCVEVGNGKIDSIFKTLEEQGELACQAINADPHYDGDFNLMGFSQGSLVARYVVEKCKLKGRVKRLLLFDGPLMGIGYIPKLTCGPLCDALTRFLNNIIYKPMVYETLNKYLSVANYYRDRYHQSDYYKRNKFLTMLNNEVVIDPEIKERFSSLEKLMLIKGKYDTTISPKESSWFEFYDENGGNIVPLAESKFYLDDFIGLRKLDEEGKVQFVTVNNEHVFCSDEEYNLYVKKFME